MNVDQSKYRTYDYITGRWWQVDPLAADMDELLALTPYNYSFNNPVRYNDPEGDCPCLIPIGWAVAEAVTVVAGIAAGVTALVALVAEGIEKNAGDANGGGYSPAVRMTMSTSKPGELTSGKFFNSDSKRNASDQKLEEIIIQVAKVRVKKKHTKLQMPEEQESRQRQIKRRKNQKRRTEMAKDKFDLLLNKYRELVATDSVKARKYIMQLDYKNNIYLLQCIAQTYLDESLLEDGSNKMRKEIDPRKWRMAEKYIIKAFSINDDNAETLYTMGKIRKVGHQKDIAIYCFKRIIKLGVNRIAQQEYSRGRSFAKELINDARFELYRLYFDTDPKKSTKYLKEFKANLKKGVGTIFHPLNKFLIGSG